jgi:4-oxalocrotonate tautomerase
VKRKEETMPHVTVKIRKGAPENKKQQLADAVVKDVVNIIGCSESSVSVAIEEIDPEDWKESVYEPLIQGKKGALYKKPGYDM